MLRLRIGLRSGSPVRVLAPRYERNERDSRVLKLSVLLLSHLACASAKLEPIATDVACGLCVFLLVTTMSCAKTAEPVEVLIGCGLTNYFLDAIQVGLCPSGPTSGTRIIFTGVV